MASTPQILQLINELDELGKTRDDAWQIPRQEGHLLYQIALSMGARLVVEVGTSYGFSGLFWGAALRRTGGRLLTIDVNPKKVESARQTFIRAGLDRIITVHQGDARAILPTIVGPIDVGFIDADKPATPAYFDLLWPKLRPGGSIVTDNVVTHRREMESFVQYVRSRTDASSIELNIGNGIEWTVKVER